MRAYIQDRSQLTGGTFLSQSINHNSSMTCMPIVAMVNRPTHFILATAPREAPVPICQIHHQKPYGLLLNIKSVNLSESYIDLQTLYYLRFWFWKFIQHKAVEAVKKRRGASRRISLLLVTNPFSIGVNPSVRGRVLVWWHFIRRDIDDSGGPTKTYYDRNHNTSQLGESRGAYCQISYWNSQNTKCCTEQPHSNVRNLFFVYTNCMSLAIAYMKFDEEQPTFQYWWNRSCHQIQPHEQLQQSSVWQASNPNC